MNKFKVGDKVYCNYHNKEGVVQKPGINSIYSVVVKFSDGSKESYIKAGYIDESRKGISLIHKVTNKVENEETKLHLIENDSYTDFANTLHFIFCQKVDPIFADYVNQGYSVREIEYIMTNAIRDLALENLLEWR